MEKQLMPSLEKDDVAIIDNMRSHHAKIVTELLNKTAISCLYLLPYSPDLNLELYWENVVKNENYFQKEESPRCCWTTWGRKSSLRNNKHESMIAWRKAFHVKHGCEIMIYGDVIQKLIMNESIIDDNKLNLAFYKLTEWILVLSEVT